MNTDEELDEEVRRRNEARVSLAERLQCEEAKIRAEWEECQRIRAAQTRDEEHERQRRRRRTR